MNLFKIEESDEEIDAIEDWIIGKFVNDRKNIFDFKVFACNICRKCGSEYKCKLLDKNAVMSRVCFKRAVDILESLVKIRGPGCIGNC